MEQMRHRGGFGEKRVHKKDGVDTIPLTVAWSRYTKFVLEDYGNKISLQKVKTKNGIAQKPCSKNLGRDRKCKSGEKEESECIIGRWKDGWKDILIYWREIENKGRRMKERIIMSCTKIGSSDLWQTVTHFHFL